MEIQLNHKHQYSNTFIQKIYDDYYFYIKLLRILEKNHPKKDIKINNNRRNLELEIIL